MPYSGRYRVKNLQKYVGNSSNVRYRSLWERQVFRWLDSNKNVALWNSEEVVVPYRCKSDNKIHRYFVDLYVKFNDGKSYLIEIKPKKQTIPPKKPTRKSKKYLNEVMVYIKNQSKWEAANAVCQRNGWKFIILTEDHLKTPKYLNYGR